MSINGFAVWSRSALVLLPLLVAVAAGGTASADDPPSRVGRIALIDGTVSFRPSPADDWSNAVMNYPVAQSTAIWVEEGARAEIEIGSARIRLAGGTELDVNQLDDQNIVFAVPQGRIDVTLNGARSDERYDVQTPRGDAVLADGRYRIIAGTQQDATSVATFTGTAQYTVNAQQFSVAPGQEAIANPIDPPTVQLSSVTQDDFDGWAAQRDGKIYARPAPATVAGVPGTQELAEYGTWRTTPDYGEVWTPADIGPDWTPYSQGRWEDVSPWGWTWIDAEPWGFTPFHYGRSAIAS